MEALVKPLYPTSTGNVNALHPACEHTDLHTIAFQPLFLPPIVSSSKMTNIAEVDQSMMSGQSDVVVIS